MPDQKDAALPINDHRLHAQGQGTGISRKETRQATNERFAAGHFAISNTRLVPRSRQLRRPPMRPVLRCHLAPGRTPMRRPQCSALLQSKPDLHRGLRPSRFAGDPERSRHWPRAHLFFSRFRAPRTSAPTSAERRLIGIIVERGQTRERSADRFGSHHLIGTTGSFSRGDLTYSSPHTR